MVVLTGTIFHMMGQTSGKSLKQKNRLKYMGSGRIQKQVSIWFANAGVQRAV